MPRPWPAESRTPRVAGAGMSWRKAWALDPRLDFWYTDRAHPSALGYYVNACVIYAALTDYNPGGLTPYCDNIEKRVITKDEAAILQKAAWQQYLDDRNSEKAAGGLD